MENKFFWLDGFEGKAKGGAYYRSRMALDVNDFETKFDKRVVGIKLEPDLESGKPSWNVEFILEEESSPCSNGA
jgi:hypothetical protein|tara:strand:- start:4253 stop:4474 length:222 start_codon:yes stop_codon:yes gene_type:complete